MRQNERASLASVKYIQMTQTSTRREEEWMFVDCTVMPVWAYLLNHLHVNLISTGLLKQLCTILFFFTRFD